MEVTIQEILEQLNQKLKVLSDTANLDAQVLVAHNLGKPRTWVLAHLETLLSVDQHRRIISSVKELERGVALPYVLGHWEFYGLDFVVDPKVLIPRPETELLVERAIGWLQSHPHRHKVLDVGTGSGCIGIAIAKQISAAHVLMTDLSVDALNVAQRNAEIHALQDRVEFRQSDLLQHVSEHFDLICANLPYIPTQALNSLSVAKKEPYQALDGGETGLILIHRLLKQASTQVDPGGLMLLEIDATQGEQIKQITQKLYPLDRIQILQDLSGKDRCLEIEKHYHIFHLCKRQDWLNCQESGEYRPGSLAVDGFIHCSLPEQIVDVANRYYKGVLDMVALSIDPFKLASEIHWEESGETYYPHVYGSINTQAVSSVIDIHPEVDGSFHHVVGLDKLNQAGVSLLMLKNQL